MNIQEKVLEILNERAEQYKTLNDAEKINKAFQKGKTEIWYYKREFGRDVGMGVDWLKEKDLLPTKKTLKKTHTLIGKIKATNLEPIFMLMQGENWSPQGEANDLIKKSGISHTSMSVGDIVILKGKMYMVDLYGFEELK